ncbi:big defensin-like [Saccostrea echinata]|uniref:big defensin-like n=1 Tax=Saccostrea echinata TaxID=191078 RepID=UPI002A7F29C1|nr:big defensin-like [Saccostrea echinata]XP_061186477.1 big defensin-like [Saccostrea echinata]
MERKAFLCILYVILLVAPGSIFANARIKKEQSRNKRQAQALLPLASFAGMSVNAPLFLALVAIYGIAEVARHTVGRLTTRDDLILDKRNHNCGNWFNDGWCREECQSHEYNDPIAAAICGGWNCCKSSV